MIFFRPQFYRILTFGTLFSFCTQEPPGSKRKSDSSVREDRRLDDKGQKTTPEEWDGRTKILTDGDWSARYGKEVTDYTQYISRFSYILMNEEWIERITAYPLS